MNTNEVLFLLQEKMPKGTRVGGILLSKEDLLDAKYFNSIYNSRINTLRYASRRDYFDNTRNMSLDEFEKIFSKDDIDKMTHILTYNSSVQDSNKLFSLSILKKYGTDTLSSDVKNAKVLSKLERGNIYMDKNGKTSWLYLGDVKITQYVNKKALPVLEGNCFIEVRVGFDVEEEVNRFFSSLGDKCGDSRVKYAKHHILKGYKKVIEQTAIYNVNKKMYFSTLKHKSYLMCERLIETYVEVK